MTGYSLHVPERFQCYIISKCYIIPKDRERMYCRVLVWR